MQFRGTLRHLVGDAGHKGLQPLHCLVYLLLFEEVADAAHVVGDFYVVLVEEIFREVLEQTASHFKVGNAEAEKVVSLVALDG